MWHDTIAGGNDRQSPDAGVVRVNITDWFFFKDKAQLQYIGLEDATDIELSAVHDDHRQLREEATTGPF